MPIKPIKTTTFRHTGVKPNGDCTDGGNVYVKRVVSTSAPKGGCGLGSCNCSPGHWLLMGKPRTSKGVVEGKTMYFSSRSDLLKYIKENEIKLTGTR